MLGDTIYLYIEKYDVQHRELLLDFTSEEDFAWFTALTGQPQSLNPGLGAHTPTMLRLPNCKPRLLLHTGEAICLPRALFSGQAPGFWQGKRPASPVIYRELPHGPLFAQWIDSPACRVVKRLPRELLWPVTPRWAGSPCALDRLPSRFELRVWNVGQGNASSIHFGDETVLFDFGASALWSISQYRRCLALHAPQLKGRRITLIISHFDCEHNSLLYMMDDDFFRRVECVLCPPEAQGLSARQLAARICRLCSFVGVVFCAPRVHHSRCGMKASFCADRFTLYTGERSTKADQSGLLLAVNSAHAVALLSADHSGYQLWEQVYQREVSPEKRLHLVIPDHGAHRSSPAVRKPPKPGMAVLSAGKETVTTLRQATLERYAQAGYQVESTTRHTGDIVIIMD